jgi:mannosyl-3-phosphoglycerate phosphatase
MTAPPARLIVTDLDGTLIDHHTYSADAARTALTAAQAAGVPVVMCSSKTRAEMHALAGHLGLRPAPLIAENGSVVWWPSTWPRQAIDADASSDADGYVTVLGATAAALLPALARLGQAVSRRLVPLSAMTLDEVMARTGRAADVASLAAAREFSQPFVVDDAEVSLATLQEASASLGVRVTQGGRFFHLLGLTDKGSAVAVVRRTCAPGHRALGLGDAPNDLALLQAVDDAVIVPQPERGWHPHLVAALPTARRAPHPGPAGWNAAVLDWLGQGGAVGGG